MRNQIATYIDNIISFLLLLVAGFTPLFFLNQTTEFFEIPKLIFLLITTTLLLGLWIFSWILKGKIVITRTPLDIPLLLLLIVVIVSTVMNPSKNISVYGNFPRVHGSAVSFVIYILLYFVTVSNLRSVLKIKNFLFVMYVAGIATALISTLSFFRIYLPFDFARTINFTPTGSSFSTVAFLLMLLPLPVLSILNPNRYMPLPMAMGVTILFGITVLLIGSSAAHVILLLVMGLCAFASKNSHSKSKGMVVVPAIVFGILALLLYVPFTGNKIQSAKAAFPQEIQLPFAVSWKVSVSAFRDAPFFGTGPSSYLFNFTSYKPAEFNALNFWNFAFDSSYNEYFQVLGTLGIFGFIAILLLSLVILNMVRRNLFVAPSDSHADSTHVMISALAASALVSVILMAIHATTLISFVASLFVFAAFIMSQKSIREKAMEFSMGIKASTSDNKQFDLLPIIFFIFYVVVVALVYMPAPYNIVRVPAYNAIAADYYHRKALSQATKSGSLTYQYLQRAETLNPQNDLYRVDMAQTNFALANAIAQQQTDKDGKVVELSDNDKKTIQQLLSQAINEGRVAVALSPRSARNWEVLAAVYRNISGVAQNSLSFSLDAYGQAIRRDPLNPALRVSVGGIYYSVKNYDLASRFFTDAANLKPDYANAYYNLSISLRDKGDIANAKLVAEQTVNLLRENTNTPDYKTATALLEDLKKQVDSNGQAQGNQTAPASQSNSALQNDNLPDVEVTGLNNPPQVSTPAAVRQNPQSNLPRTATPTPRR